VCIFATTGRNDGAVNLPLVVDVVCVTGAGPLLFAGALEDGKYG
jgi:hypothetical protein